MTSASNCCGASEGQRDRGNQGHSCKLAVRRVEGKCSKIREVLTSRPKPDRSPGNYHESLETSTCGRNAEAEAVLQIHTLMEVAVIQDHGTISWPHAASMHWTLQPKTVCHATAQVKRLESSLVQKPNCSIPIPPAIQQGALVL